MTMPWDRRLAVLESQAAQRAADLEAKGIIAPTATPAPPAVCLPDPKPESVDGRS